MLSLAARYGFMFGPENALMELAAGIVWAFWNMVSPEKEEKDQIGRDLFKYEGDRIEKVGSRTG